MALLFCFVFFFKFNQHLFLVLLTTVKEPKIDATKILVTNTRKSYRILQTNISKEDCNKDELLIAINIETIKLYGILKTTLFQ